MMESTKPEGTEFKRFLGAHWKVSVIFGSGIALLFAGAVYVFLWFAGNAQSSGLVPQTLGLWSMADLITFVIYGAFWELLLIGIPTIALLVTGWYWWRNLTEDERKTYHFFEKSSRRRSSGGLSLLFFIVFSIKVLIDGRWNMPIASWTLDYVVGSVFTILVWGAVLIGIPATVGMIWWMRRVKP